MYDTDRAVGEKASGFDLLFIASQETPHRPNVQPSSRNSTITAAPPPFPRLVNHSLIAPANRAASTPSPTSSRPSPLGSVSSNSTEPVKFPHAKTVQPVERHRPALRPNRHFRRKFSRVHFARSITEAISRKKSPVLSYLCRTIGRARDFFSTLHASVQNLAAFGAQIGNMLLFSSAFPAKESHMHAKNILGAIIAAVCIVAAAAAPSAAAAPPSDACPLLTPAEITAVVGVTVGAGAHMTPTYVKSCTWSPSGGAAKDFTTLVLALEPAASYQSAKAMLQAVAGSQGKGGSP